MARFISLIYGAFAYVVFFGTILYAIAFVENVFVPTTIDGVVRGGVFSSLIIDTLLLGVFAVQHSVMARPKFKAWWTQFVPKPVERSTYVLFASGALILLLWQWRPMDAVLWSIPNEAAARILFAVSMLGWMTVFASTFMINHFELFGLKQVIDRLREKAQADHTAFKTPMLYNLVRHPIYLGFLIAFWSAAHMTLGHFVFAAATTGYIFIGIFLEERDLVAVFGKQYVEYRKRVRMILPVPRGRASAAVRDVRAR